MFKNLFVNFSISRSIKFKYSIVAIVAQYWEDEQRLWSRYQIMTQYWFRHHERRNLDKAIEVSGPWSSKRLRTMDQLKKERNQPKTSIDTEQTIKHCTFLIALFFFSNALPRNISTDANPKCLQKYRSYSASLPVDRWIDFYLSHAVTVLW